jgi:hypothetical protein
MLGFSCAGGLGDNARRPEAPGRRKALKAACRRRHSIVQNGAPDAVHPSPEIVRSLFQKYFPGPLDCLLAEII